MTETEALRSGSGRTRSWYDAFGTPYPQSPRRLPHVRADIADEMLQALKRVRNFITGGPVDDGRSVLDELERAIAKAEPSE